jgi:hypothetical protein
MKTMSLASINHENGKLQDSLLVVLKDSNGNLIESNEITKNFVALKEKGEEGIN